MSVVVADRSHSVAIDCCIAELAVENGALNLRRDRDFEVLSEHSSLQEEFVRWNR